MIPDIQQIFDSVANVEGPWIYVGKYVQWTLYGIAINDGTTSVEAVSYPTGIFIGESLTNPTALQSLGIQSDNVYTPPYQPTAARWQPFTTYPTNSLITDYNNNVQQATVGGVSGAKVPTWATTGTTVDNTITWTFLQVQGNSNYNAAPASLATPAGVVICPTMSTSADLNSGATPTGFGTVLYNSGNGTALYIPTDDIYIGYIRVVKTGGTGSPPSGTIVYLCGQMDS